MLGMSSLYTNDRSLLFLSCPLQTERGFKEYLAYLPPLEIATEQAVILTFLGSVFHTK